MVSSWIKSNKRKNWNEPPIYETRLELRENATTQLTRRPLLVSIPSLVSSDICLSCNTRKCRYNVFLCRCRPCVYVYHVEIWPEKTPPNAESDRVISKINPSNAIHDAMLCSQQNNQHPARVERKVLVSVFMVEILSCSHPCRRRHGQNGRSS